MNDDGSDRTHFRLTLYFFVQFINIVSGKVIKCFSLKLNKIDTKSVSVVTFLQS